MSEFESGYSSVHEQIQRLWEIPERVPEDFRIPEGVVIGVATGNKTKAEGMQGFIHSLNGQAVQVSSREEDKIKASLHKTHILKSKLDREGGASDDFRVLNIAERKADYTKEEIRAQIPEVTHVMGLDVDVQPWGEREPLGIPKTREQLIRNLEAIKGQYYTIKSAAALKDLTTERIVSDQLHITFPVRDFDVAEYLREHDDGVDTIGKVAGGIDFTDERNFSLIGKGAILIDRDWHHSPDFNPLVQLERTIHTDSSHAGEVLATLEDAIKGTPFDMIKLILYNSFRNSQ